MIVGSSLGYELDEAGLTLELGKICFSLPRIFFLRLQLNVSFWNFSLKGMDCGCWVLKQWLLLIVAPPHTGLPLWLVVSTDCISVCTSRYCQRLLHAYQILLYEIVESLLLLLKTEGNILYEIVCLAYIMLHNVQNIQFSFLPPIHPSFSLTYFLSPSPSLLLSPLPLLHSSFISSWCVAQLNIKLI